MWARTARDAHGALIPREHLEPYKNDAYEGCRDGTKRELKWKVLSGAASRAGCGPPCDLP